MSVNMEPDPVFPFRHHGRTGEMLRLALVNLGLNIVTLSIWRFWGRTRVRRLLWGRTVAWNDPVDYTGTGGELFRGFLLALLVVYLPLLGGLSWAQMLMIESGGLLGEALFGILYLLAALLVAGASYRARRYQMSRTVWRGIRGGQQGSATGYAGRALLVWTLVPLTLGWALPWGEMMLARYKLEHTAFGSRRFSCDATAGAVYRHFAVVWLCGLALIGALGQLAVSETGEEGIAGIDGGSAVAGFPLLGLLALVLPWAWYRAALYRRLAAGTAFDGCRFALDIATWPLIGLVAGNTLISLLSLGVLRPWAALRTFRFVCAATTIAGIPDFAAIAQAAAGEGGTGEGVMTVLDGAGEF